jgi:O-antigen/teichoic acid export membrane protein
MANKAIRFLAAIIIARFLGASAFGIFNVGIAIAGVLVTASALGLPDVGARTVAARPAVAPFLVVPVLVGRLAALAVGSIGFAVAIAFVWPHHTFFAAATIAMAAAMTVTLDWLARGLERMRVVALASTLSGLVACAAAIVVASRGSAELVLIAFAVGEATAAIVCWWGVASASRPLALDLSPIRSLVRSSWPIGLAAIVTYSYYANVDTVILASFRSAHEAGVYSAAYRIFLAFNVVSIFAAYASFPIVARLSESGVDAEANATISSILTRLLFYGALVVGLVECAGDLTLRLLFGEAFTGATKTFTLLAIAAAWYAVGYVGGYSLIATRRPRGYVAGSIAAGVLCIGLDLLFIPTFGMIGAAAATLVAFVVAAIIWLEQQKLPPRRNAILLSSLGAISGGAIMTLAVPETRLIIGVATVTAAGLSLLVTSMRVGTTP